MIIVRYYSIEAFIEELERLDQATYVIRKEVIRHKKKLNNDAYLVMSMHVVHNDVIHRMIQRIWSGVCVVEEEYEKEVPFIEEVEKEFMRRVDIQLLDSFHEPEGKKIARKVEWRRGVYMAPGETELITSGA